VQTRRCGAPAPLRRLMERASEVDVWKRVLLQPRVLRLCLHQNRNGGVKAIRNKKSVGWPIMRDAIKDNIIYVLVCLNDPGAAPEYFILTSAEARERTKQYPTRGIIDLSGVRDGKYRERWDKIENALTPVAASPRKRKPTL
jgi:hypothetical protein